MDPITEINTIILNRKLPNALLFTGHCGQEKKKTAITFAKSINCLNRKFESDDLNNEISSGKILDSDLQSDSLPCNRCRSCAKIDAFMHPDIITVIPESNNTAIKIGQIRELCGALASKPHEAKMRVVIIEDAHAMNKEAANAILKILEEPPERTIFLLIANDLNNLLPTIISRCRHIGFKPISRRELAAKLTVEWNIEPSVAMIAAMSSNGDMEKAMMFADVKHHDGDLKSANKQEHGQTDTVGSSNSRETGDEWFYRRHWLLNQLFLIVNPEKNPSILYLHALALAEKLSRENALVPDIIALIKLWLRDIALIKYSKKDATVLNLNYIINSDFAHALSESADTLPTSYPLAALENIHMVETKLVSNASIRMILEHFFLSLIPPTLPGKNISSSNNNIGIPS